MTGVRLAGWFISGVAICVMVTLSAAPGPRTAADDAVTLVRVPNDGVQPQAAVDAQGRVHVVYAKYAAADAAHADLFYVRLDARGQFSKPIQINSQPGSGIATGTMRGPHLALGRGGRVHVAWHGSDKATPRAAGGETPVMYTRLNAAGTAFEPERNVVQQTLTGLDGGTVAADPLGQVYVAWHAFRPDTRGEADRRVWIAKSSDDGKTFAREVPASEAATGACGCCAVGAMADRRGTLFVLYRAARDTTQRGTYLLTSRDRGVTFASEELQRWEIAACPMSTYALADAPTGILAAWETAGQVQWLRMDPTTGRRSPLVVAPGAAGTRKHPSIAANSRGETLLVWTEGTGWNKGGGLAWQLYDRNAMPVVEGQGRAEGVPTWGLGTVVARPDGGFVIVY
jgi:hypothetical protein